MLDAVEIVCYAAPMTASPLPPDFEALLDGYKADYMAARNLSEKTRVECETDICLLYTSPSPRDGLLSRMPSSA